MYTYILSIQGSVAIRAAHHFQMPMEGKPVEIQSWKDHFFLKPSWPLVSQGCIFFWTYQGFPDRVWVLSTSWEAELGQLEASGRVRGLGGRGCWGPLPGWVVGLPGAAEHPSPAFPAV